MDGYTETCESILYGMICDEADEDTEGAFLGSDGDHLSLELAAGAEEYKAFLWSPGQEPLAGFEYYSE